MLRKKIIIAGVVILASACGLIWGKSATESASCEPNCSEKSIGTINPLGNTFVPNPPGTPLVQNQEYWLRIKVEGQDTVPPTLAPGATPPPPTGRDIYMTLDGSSSMTDLIPEFKATADPKITMLEASKKTMSAFVDKSIGKNIHMGLGLNVWCEHYRQFSPELQIEWIYENDLPYDLNGQNKTGRGLVLKHLQQLDGQQAAFKATINALGFQAVPQSDGTIDYRNLTCRGAFGGGGFIPLGAPWGQGLSTLGAAVSLANFEFSNILFDPDAKRPSDNTRIAVSRDYTEVGTMTHGGPRARDMTGIVIPKIHVLVTDGGDGVPPFYNDEEVDKASRAIYERAKDNNIKIFAITFSPIGSPKYNRLQTIVNYVGGKLYRFDSAEEMVEKFDLLYDDINAQFPVPVPTPGIAQSKVIVKEIVNSSHFKMLDPENDLTFRVTQEVAGVETTIQNVLCPDIAPNTPLTGKPDCVSNKQYSGANLTGFNVTLDPLKFGDIRYIYAKVVPIATGNNILVDNPASELEYPDLNLGPCPSACPDIPNFQVDIGEPPSYFQVISGDVYSGAANIDSIVSILPSAIHTFLTTKNGIVMSKGSAEYGLGKVSPSLQNVEGYTVDSSSFYDQMYDRYKDRMSAISLNNLDLLSSSAPAIAYIDPAVDALTPMRIQGVGWNNKVIAGKRLVVFVPGDLLIKVPFTVAKDGKSSILFVVKGSIGIDPGVSKVEGAYLTDGRIDTLCSGNFQPDLDCSPGKNPATENQLTLEGVYFAGSGFNLDRNVAGTTPAELFSYRPDLFFSMIETAGKNVYHWSENVE